VSYEVEYYVLGHLSKFVQPGAVRIASTHRPGQLETVAFLNPDRSRVLVALNVDQVPVLFSVVEGDQTMNVRLPARTVATVMW
ncbi:MAG: glycoside hydrolase family 30 beta sandwich domain-containing protein, partial [Bacteroidota bacterium]